MGTQKLFVFGLMGLGTTLFAAGNGGGGGGGGVPTPGVAEVRVLNEKIPAGGTVQVKYSLTTPRPISGGGPKLLNYDFAVNGVAITSPQGDAAGVALSTNGVLAVEIISPNGDYGTNLDYPFLTVAMTIPPTAKTGTVYPMPFPDTVYQTPTGPVTLSNTKPGALTIGGSVSIHGLVPGGGTWPAGTLIHLQGTGFVPNTKITSKMKTSNAFYVSPTEMVFFLSQATTLDTQPVTAQNPDGSSSTYYSYLRGVPVSAPTRAMLQRADPIFQGQTHALATVGPVPALGAGQFQGLAVQNPNPWPVSVSLYHQQSGSRVTVFLPSGGRMMDELGALFHGLNVQAGDVITVSATSPVQILGLNGDDTAGTLTPFLPQF